MALGLDLGKNLQQALVRANQKRSALDAANLLAIHVLIAHHVKLIAHLLIDIGEQRVGQTIFFLEFLLRFRRVARNTEHHRARFLQLAEASRNPQASMVQPGVSARG